MEKAYKFRIYPNKQQEELINKTFGCCRFVYNKYLAKRIELYENNKETYSYKQCSSDLTNLKKELVWLKEVDSTSLQSSLKDLETAYKKFFKEKSGFPKFKSKKTNRFSYKTKYTNGNIEYLRKHIKLPKIGMVKIRDKQIPQGRILNATISKEPSGKYFVSLCCTDVEVKRFENTNSNIGLDLGIKEFCITSNGETIENPKYLKKSLNKLAKLQRELSRKSKGSSNRNKARLKVARLQERISNQRKDFLQKLSTKLIKENDIIAGSSAKKAPTKIETVKKAIFINEQERNDMKKAIKKYKPDAILILGTSDGMVDKITDNLGLPRPMKRIYINEVATEEEMKTAKMIRTTQGKHVIPVPTFEIKKDFSGYILDPLQIFKFKGKGNDPYISEKSIIRPTFSYLGNFTISDTVFRQIAEYLAKKTGGVYKLSRARVESYPEGPDIYLEVVVNYGYNILTVLREFKERYKKEIENLTTMNVQKITVVAKGIHMPEKEEE